LPGRPVPLTVQAVRTKRQRLLDLYLVLNLRTDADFYRRASRSSSGTTRSSLADSRSWRRRDRERRAGPAPRGGAAVLPAGAPGPRSARRRWAGAVATAPRGPRRGAPAAARHTRRAADEHA